MDKTQNDQAKRTIVGGRPRRRGLGGAGIPRGIEVLIKKASVDPAFCRLLLEKRAAAASHITLELTPSEIAILDSVPETQLQAMIDHTTVPDAQRRAFLGTLGAAMLAALVAGCRPPTETAATATTAVTRIIEKEVGIRPGEETRLPTGTTPTPMVIEKGIRLEDMTREAQPTITPKATPTLKPSPTTAETDDQPAPEPQPTPPVVRGTRPDRP